MNRLRWVIENGGEVHYWIKKICLFMFLEWRNRRGIRELSLPPVDEEPCGNFRRMILTSARAWWRSNCRSALQWCRSASRFESVGETSTIGTMEQSYLNEDLLRTVRPMIVSAPLVFDRSILSSRSVNPLAVGSISLSLIIVLSAIKHQQKFMWFSLELPFSDTAILALWLGT
jgi:hypothetical protein